MVTNFIGNSSFMRSTLHFSFFTKACGHVIFFKVVFVSSNVAFVTFVALPLEISSCSWISTWSIKISWPPTCPWILPYFNSSKVHKKSYNKSSCGAVHYRVNRFPKSACLAHLNLLVFIFINYNIFWVSFTLDVVFFLTSFSTCYFARFFPFIFIMALVLDCGC